MTVTMHNACFSSGQIKIWKSIFFLELSGAALLGVSW